MTSPIPASPRRWRKRSRLRSYRLPTTAHAALPLSGSTETAPFFLKSGPIVREAARQTAEPWWKEIPAKKNLKLFQPLTRLAPYVCKLSLPCDDRVVAARLFGLLQPFRRPPGIVSCHDIDRPLVRIRKSVSNLIGAFKKLFRIFQAAGRELGAACPEVELRLRHRIQAVALPAIPIDGAVKQAHQLPAPVHLMERPEIEPAINSVIRICLCQRTEVDERPVGTVFIIEVDVGQEVGRLRPCKDASGRSQFQFRKPGGLVPFGEKTGDRPQDRIVLCDVGGVIFFNPFCKIVVGQIRHHCNELIVRLVACPADLKTLKPPLAVCVPAGDVAAGHCSDDQGIGVPRFFSQKIGRSMVCLRHLLHKSLVIRRVVKIGEHIPPELHAGPQLPDRMFGIPHPPEIEGIGSGAVIQIVEVVDSHDSILIKTLITDQFNRLCPGELRKKGKAENADHNKQRTHPATRTCADRKRLPHSHQTPPELRVVQDQGMRPPPPFRASSAGAGVRFPCETDRLSPRYTETLQILKLLQSTPCKREWMSRPNPHPD